MMWGNSTPKRRTAAAVRAMGGGRGAGTSLLHSHRLKESFSREPPPTLLPWSWKNQTHEIVLQFCLFDQNPGSIWLSVTCSSMYLWLVPWRAGPTISRSSRWQRGGNRVSSEHGWFRLSWPDRSVTNWFITKPKLSTGGAEKQRTIFQLVLLKKHNQI